LPSTTALCDRELDLEMADVLPRKETLGVPTIVVAPTITVTPVVGVAIATQVLSNESSNGAWVFQYVHVG
jgi:hypothetical protein